MLWGVSQDMGNSLLTGEEKKKQTVRGKGPEKFYEKEIGPWRSIQVNIKSQEKDLSRMLRRKKKSSESSSERGGTSGGSPSRNRRRGDELRKERT